jgi:hypothetical protein
VKPTDAEPVEEIRVPTVFTNGKRKIDKLLCFKGYHQVNKKTTHRMGENIFDRGLIPRIYKEL